MAEVFSESLDYPKVKARAVQSRSYRVKLPDSVVTPESYVPENYETRKRLRINKVLNFRDTIKFWAESLEVNHSSKFQ